MKLTREGFNEKYKDYLEKGFYGLAIDNQNVINYLDDRFENEFTHIPDFTYSQIKLKFGNCSFYSNLGHGAWAVDIQNDINAILNES